MALIGQAGDPANFLKQLTDQRDADLELFLLGVYSAIPVLPKAIKSTFQATGKSGSYGTLLTCSADANRCFKRIQLGTNKEMYMFLKELFVQYYLHADPLLGARIPEIYAVYYDSGLGEEHITVEMELAQMDVDSYIKTLPHVDFETFYRITHDVFSVLQSLNIQYGFVHRDLKPDNLVMKQIAGGPLTLANSVIQFIDFGFSCLTVSVDGANYRIVCGGRFQEGVPCFQQQDVVFFLYFLLRKRTLDERTKTFIEQFLAPALKGRLNMRAQGKKYPFHAAYNNRGNLFNDPVKAAHFTIAGLLDALNTERARPAGGGGGGGGGGSIMGISAAAGGPSTYALFSRPPAGPQAAAVRAPHIALSAAAGGPSTYALFSRPPAGPQAAAVRAPHIALSAAAGGPSTYALFGRPPAAARARSVAAVKAPPMAMSAAAGGPSTYALFGRPPRAPPAGPQASSYALSGRPPPLVPKYTWDHYLHAPGLKPLGKEEGPHNIFIGNQFNSAKSKEEPPPHTIINMGGHGRRRTRRHRSRRHRKN